MKQRFLKTAVISCFVIFCFTGIPNQLSAQTNSTYSFIVAGHAYGAHSGTNIGLHPNLLESLNAGYDSTVSFFVFTGDIVNQSTQESWDQVKTEMDGFGLPYYYVMGNHDNNFIGNEVFIEKYGSTHYAFRVENELYIVLNSTESDRSISSTQLTFLKNTLDTTDNSVKNIFIFFHEIIWNSHEKYKGVKSNSRSRYDQIIGHSNYWTEVHPMLLQYPDKDFYLIAGDVAGNTDAIPCFYDKWDNITFLASGMGEVVDENYLLIKVIDNDNVAVKVVSLNSEITMNDIKYYSVPEQPQQIYGDTIVDSEGSSYNYSVDEVYNAESYIWELPENATGNSSTNTINVAFDNLFREGDLTVEAFKEGFGSSPKTLIDIKSVSLSINDQFSGKLNFNVAFENETCKVRIVPGSNDKLTFSVYNLMGAKIYTDELLVKPGVEQTLETGNLTSGILIFELKGKREHRVKKVLFKTSLICKN